MNLVINDTYQNVNSGNLVKIKGINDEEVIYNYIESGGAVGDFITTVTNFMKHYEFVPPPVQPDSDPACADSDSMPIIRGNTYKNKENGLLVEVTELNYKVRFKFVEGKPAGNKFSLTFEEFRRCYMNYPTGPACVDLRKECFACKEPIELGYEKTYQGAYYHKDCLINGKKNNAFLADNEPVNISDLQQGDFCENYYKPTREQVEALMAKPGKIIINAPINISDLNFKIDKLNLELTKAHQLIGKLTLKLEQYK